jgi:hypothetical protein
MSSINGIGSTYIGCSDVGRDGSYVTTKWVIFILPIAPVGSFRVLPVSHVNLGVYSSSEFQAQPVPLYWPHVIWMYATYLVAAAFIGVADRLTGPKSNNIISSPLLSSAIAFALSLLAIWISGFIRKGSVFANLIVFAAVITFSFIASANMSAQPDRSWQYMYFLWAAYAVFVVFALRKKKDPPKKTAQRARRV